MLNDKTLGVRIPDTKTFYYIEAGDNWIGNTVDRIKKTLIHLQLILLTQLDHKELLEEVK